MRRFDLSASIPLFLVLIFGFPRSISTQQDDAAQTLTVNKVEKAFEITCRAHVNDTANIRAMRKCRDRLKAKGMSVDSSKEYAKAAKFFGPKTIPLYHSKCTKFLDDMRAAPPADESEALKDDGKEYDLKGYAHCLLDTVRQINGDKAISFWSPLKSRGLDYRTPAPPKRDWMKVIHEEENKFRARHGVQPLELNQTVIQAPLPLIKDAQEQAEQNAKDCNINHSDLRTREKNTRGFTGENLCWRQANQPIDDVAERCANGWYEEIQYYPFPEGWEHESDGSKDGALKKFGHFSQMVWDESWAVGYGLVSTRNCKSGRLEHYVAARYYPGGNMLCCFRFNVFPPKV